MNTIKTRIAAAGLGVLLALAVQASDDGLPAIDADAVTVSGISSGGAMAQQLHLAYADLFSGAGIIAGIPFDCAEANLGLALGRCVGKEDGPLPVERMLERYRALAAEAQVADPSLLSDDRVWLFRGAQDEAVPAKVADAVAAFYADLVPAERLNRVDDVPAAHLFPTLEAGSACDVSESPWLGACDYDAAGEILRSLYPGLAAPSDEDAEGTWREVDLAGAAGAGMDSRAFLYVPGACPESGCRLHVALHGCLQSVSNVDRAFLEQAGYLRWADANGIVLAFPQAVASAVNPLACWDWWGYTGANYAHRDGAQTALLADWIRSLLAD